MLLLAIVVVALVVSFAGVLLFGAPYLPTLTPQVKAALELADLKKGETLLELGCGDGKVVVAAAQAGYRVIGYELNPFLFAIAWLRTRRYRKLASVRLCNFWRVKLPPAQAIFVFLLPKFMPRLDKKLDAYNCRPLRLVSFAFKIPGKAVQAEKAGVFLYLYK